MRERGTVLPEQVGCGIACALYVTATVSES
jgi:hypothetical protein